VGDTPVLNVVFDTNTYLGFGSEVLIEIRRHESHQGIRALASVWPCLELLARFAGEDASKSRRAVATLKKAWEHSGYAGPSGPRLRMHEAAEVALARGLFGLTPEEPLLQHGYVADLIAAAVTLEVDKFRQKHREDLEGIASRVAAEERRFIQLARALGSADGSHATGTWEVPPAQRVRLVAGGLFIALAEQFGVQLRTRELGPPADHLIKHFPVAMHFADSVFAQITATGVPPGGGNTTWDMKIAFHVGPGARIAGIPTVLVTNEKRFARAAMAAGIPTQVLRSDEYIAMLRTRDAVAEYSNTLLEAPGS